MAVRTDVCLILEGTYPYIAGGVSSWVHQLVSSLDHIRFSLMVLLPTEEYGKELKYELPENIMEISEAHIHDYQPPQETSKRDKRKQEQAFGVLNDFVESSLHGDYSQFPALLDLLTGSPPTISTHDILYSPEAWDVFEALYKKHHLDASFIDLFWTFRFSILPLLKTVNAKIPKARIYHAVATGYAGILGSMATLRNPDSSLILTEHGIYAKERRIEIADARWLYDEFEDTMRPDHEQSFFKQWWTELFLLFSKITYEHSDLIITLYDGNRRAQIEDGADPDKCVVISNGLDMRKFQSDKPRVLPSQKSKHIVALVGRVVPIKDVKTFINACRIVCDDNPNTECWICGPTDEDPQYYGDCLIMRNLMGLEDQVLFKGRLNMLEHYPDIDVIVLTSVSEAMPLVILEGYCYGIPVVATDVGCCRGLVEGCDEEDRRRGHSGVITGISSPDDTAKAVKLILGDDDLYGEMGDTGRERVAEHYQEQDLFAKYMNIYEDHL